MLNPTPLRFGDYVINGKGGGDAYQVRRVEMIAHLKKKPGCAHPAIDEVGKAIEQAAIVDTALKEGAHAAETTGPAEGNENPAGAGAPELP